MDECLQLGRALRHGDAQSFFQVYDRLLQDSTVSDHDVSKHTEGFFARTLKVIARIFMLLTWRPCSEQSSILIFSSWRA